MAWRPQLLDIVLVVVIAVLLAAIALAVIARRDVQPASPAGPDVYFAVGATIAPAGNFVPFVWKLNEGGVRACALHFSDGDTMAVPCGRGTVMTTERFFLEPGEYTVSFVVTVGLGTRRVAAEASFQIHADGYREGNGFSGGDYDSRWTHIGPGFNVIERSDGFKSEIFHPNLTQATLAALTAKLQYVETNAGRDSFLYQEWRENTRIVEDSLLLEAYFEGDTTLDLASAPSRDYACELDVYAGPYVNDEGLNGVRAFSGIACREITERRHDKHAQPESKGVERINIALTNRATNKTMDFSYYSFQYSHSACTTRAGSSSNVKGITRHHDAKPVPALDCQSSPAYYFPASDSTNETGACYAEASVEFVISGPLPAGSAAELANIGRTTKTFTCR